MNMHDHRPSKLRMLLYADHVNPETVLQSLDCLPEKAVEEFWDEVQFYGGLPTVPYN